MLLVGEHLGIAIFAGFMLFIYSFCFPIIAFILLKRSFYHHDASLQRLATGIKFSQKKLQGLADIKAEDACALFELDDLVYMNAVNMAKDAAWRLDNYG